MIETTVHAKLIAKKDGIYTVYVFQENNEKLHMCTKLPNWGLEYNLRLGDEGFVTMQYVTAGEQFYNRLTNETSTIKFTNNYFKEFIKDNPQFDKIIL